MPLSYLHYDVFTDKPLLGNQLAVFTDAQGLDGPQMQAIAREKAGILKRGTDGANGRGKIDRQRRECSVDALSRLDRRFGLCRRLGQGASAKCPCRSLQGVSRAFRCRRIAHGQRLADVFDCACLLLGKAAQ